MSDLQPLLDAILGLKEVKRAGWAAKAGVKNPESVADHTFSTCAIGMTLSDIMGLDTEKVIRMALLHDLAEVIVGDYMPGEVTARKKMELEKKAMRDILSCLPASVRARYESMWYEYLQNKTREARFVHRVDKLEMGLQAARYRRNVHDEKSLEQFFESARKSVVTDDEKEKSEDDMLTDIIKSLQRKPEN